METFKPIITEKQDYTGLYGVSNCGKIKSLPNSNYKSERILKPSLNKNYYHIRLVKNGKKETRTNHTLVWDAFGDKKRNGRKLQVDHIDNDKSNNHIDNLQILTQRENTSKSVLLNDKKSSKYVGVSWYKSRNKWESYIDINGKRKKLGYFTNEYDANLCYQKTLQQL